MNVLERQREVFKILQEHADAGQPCPSNNSLAERFGCSTSTICEAFLALQRRGLIAIKRGAKSRSITISATGQELVSRFRETGAVSQKRLLVDEMVREKMRERDERAERQRTYRDPCHKCGVRADYGCKHTIALAA